MDKLPARFQNRQAPSRAIAGGVVSGLGGATPPTLSIMGNAFTLIDASGEEEAIETRYIDVVIMDVNLQVPLQRVFYGVKYDPNNTQAPLCFSDNGIGASSQAREPQSANCKTCPNSQWTGPGAVVGQNGKLKPSCQTLKKLAVLPLIDDAPIYDMPFLLRVPVMSHAALQAYGKQFVGKQFDVSDVVTRISFAHGEVGKLEFEARKESPWVIDEVDALVNRILEANATDNLVGRNDVPVTGQLAAPASQEQPKAIASPAPVAAPIEPDTKPRGRPRKLASKPAESAPLPQQEAKPAPVATPRPLPSFLQPKGNSPAPTQSNGTSQVTQPAAPSAPPTQPPSELQAALNKAFNLKV